MCTMAKRDCTHIYHKQAAMCNSVQTLTGPSAKIKTASRSMARLGRLIGTGIGPAVTGDAGGAVPESS